ncbi:hypothetical protein GQ53DRAFT_826942 [Thozetella sp. PMI_491]|nr:hypothetical protein GQ53DRAFT_826942 [Thozetella sp. PMI_491]
MAPSILSSVPFVLTRFIFQGDQRRVGMELDALYSNLSSRRSQQERDETWAKHSTEPSATILPSNRDAAPLIVPADLSTPLRDRITQRFLKTCPKLGPLPLFSCVYLIQDNLVAKVGPHVHPSEAAALCYLRDIVGIKEAPRVVDCFQERESGNWCIIMERIRGISLDVVLDDYTDEEREHVTKQLRETFDKMRAHRSPKIASLAVDTKGSIVYGGVRDRFFLGGRDGPFDDECTFAEALYQSLRARSRGYATECVGLLLHHFFGKSKTAPPFVLTNASLGPHNILVDGCRVVGIVSWSQAGFYPEYWEYVKASFWEDDFFGGRNVIAKALKPYLVQLSVLLHARDIVW